MGKRTVGRLDENGLPRDPNAWTAAGAAAALLGAWISTIGFSARPPKIAS